MTIGAIAAAGDVTALIGKTKPETEAVTAAPVNPEKASTISPHIKADPVAGVIIQVFDNKGDVATQYPSQAAVAYLKAGLTAEGDTKKDDVATVA